MLVAGCWMAGDAELGLRGRPAARSEADHWSAIAAAWSPMP